MGWSVVRCIRKIYLEQNVLQYFGAVLIRVLIRGGECQNVPPLRCEEIYSKIQQVTSLSWTLFHRGFDNQGRILIP